MSYWVNPSNNPDIDGVLWGWRWAPTEANGHTVLSYSFPTTVNDYQGYTYIVGFQAFSAFQQAAALKILAMYDAVCNIDFVAAGTGVANIRLAEANSMEFGQGAFDITHAFGCAPDPNFVPLFMQGDTWFNHTYYNSPTLGSFGFAAGLMHEIGHALGLKHGHLTQAVRAADGTIQYTNPMLPPDHNSIEYSIMTYRSYVGAPATGNVDAVEFPSTPMQDDILTLQWLYGVNFDYRAGNTVYRWSPATGECFVNGAGQGATFHHKIFMTVWDGGGVDTYDFSNYGSSAVVNLNPGAWSTPFRPQRADLDYAHPGKHMARGCIANALLLPGDGHGYIENAIGGRGSDNIYGNVVANLLSGLAGNDLLYGALGTDTLIGGAGRDKFVFNSTAESLSGARRDTIADFRHVQGDRIDLHQIDADQRTGHDGNQAFVYIGTDSFRHYHNAHHGIVAMVRFDPVTHLLQGNVDDFTDVDFEIRLPGVHGLAAGDLIL